MKTILILTDFSEAAFRAAEYACEWAGPLQMERMVLFHAYQSIIGGTEIPVTLDSQQIYLESMQALGLLHDRIRPLVDHDIRIDLMAEDTFLPDRINQLCRDEAVDLIAMGTSGKSGIEKLLMGRMTSKIQQDSAVPVLIVPHEAWIGKGVASVVFSTDFKDLSSIPAGPLYEILNAFKADLHVVHVSPEGQDVSEVPAALQDLLNPYSPNFHFVPGDDIAERILAFSEQHHASMIIAIHKQYGFFSNLMHQSISKKLAYHAKVPLLSLPA